MPCTYGLSPGVSHPNVLLCLSSHQSYLLNTSSFQPRLPSFKSPPDNALISGSTGLNRFPSRDSDPWSSLTTSSIPVSSSCTKKPLFRLNQLLDLFPRADCFEAGVVEPTLDCARDCGLAEYMDSCSVSFESCCVLRDVRELLKDCLKLLRLNSLRTTGGRFCPLCKGLLVAEAGDNGVRKLSALSSLFPLYAPAGGVDCCSVGPCTSGEEAGNAPGIEDVWCSMDREGRWKYASGGQ